MIDPQAPATTLENEYVETDTLESFISPYLPPKRTGWKKKAYQRRMQFYFDAIWLRRIKRIFKAESQIDILDAGCGPGYFCSVLKKTFPNAQITGLDIEYDLLRFAYDEHKPLSLALGSAQALSYPDEAFDLVFSNQVVEHLPEPTQFFAEAHRVLKPNGVICFSTPNPEGLAATTLGEKWVGHRFDHISLASPSEWRQSIIEANFTPIQDGTTVLTGFPQMQRLPLSILNYGLILLNGFYPWYRGESYMCIARKS